MIFIFLLKLRDFKSLLFNTINLIVNKDTSIGKGVLPWPGIKFTSSFLWESISIFDNQINLGWFLFCGCLLYISNSSFENCEQLYWDLSNLIWFNCQNCLFLWVYLNTVELAVVRLTITPFIFYSLSKVNIFNHNCCNGYLFYNPKQTDNAALT